MKIKTINSNGQVRMLRSALCLVIPMISLGSQAKVVNIGGPEWEVRFDNTLRYNAAVRTEKQNSDFLRSPAYDDTENKFKRGDLVTNRIDLLTELDVVFRDRHGFRLSTAAWYDHAYRGNPKPNSALADSGNYTNNHYNSFANRYVAGPSGEILDAFFFSNFYIDDVGVGLKVGKHNVYWGESLFTIGNGVAYSQGPVDTIKSAATPGTPAKELFLPIEQISAEISLSEELSLGLQYAFDWKPFRLVPGGTFYAGSDGSRSDLGAPPAVFNGNDLEPSRKRGDYGINMRWSPWQLGGTVGVYYRKFDEKLPWSFTQVQPGSGPLVRLGFSRDTELFGLSLSKNIATMSVAAEVTHRKNTALVSRSGYPVMLGAGQSMTYGQAKGAEGNSWHALVNAIYMLPKTALWEGGQLQAELTYNRLDKVTSDPENRFNARGAGCTSTYSRHCVTRDAWGIQARFTPEWPQLFPGWNVSLPINVAYGIEGNSPTLGGTNEGVYTWSVGVEGQYQYKHNFGVSYIDSYSPYRANAAGIVTSDQTIGTPVQNNHGRISFNYRVSF